MKTQQNSMTKGMRAKLLFEYDFKISSILSQETFDLDNRESIESKQDFQNQIPFKRQEEEKGSFDINKLKKFADAIGFKLVNKHKGYINCQEKALAKSSRRPSLNLRFETGQIESLRMEARFDVVVSLFHVMSYLATDRDLQSAFDTARYHLKPDGIFIFDCWYGPAVLTDPPSVRVKRVGNDVVEVIRIAEPEVMPNENIVTVNYQVLVLHKASGKIMESLNA